MTSKATDPQMSFFSSEQMDEIVRRKVDELRKILENAGGKNAVIGVSGGIDSAVSLRLAVRAVGERRVHAFHLPAGVATGTHYADAQAVCDAAGVKLGMLSIGASADWLAVRVGANGNDTKAILRRGNIAARMRMIVLFDQAQALDALVVGTENRTENLLGYFTRFGDAASDVEPICDLYKTEVRTLARFLGVPERIIAKDPSAALWEGQTDEDELGFTYDEADLTLRGRLDLDLGSQDVPVAPEIQAKVLGRVMAVTWKRNVPYEIPVGGGR